MSVVTAENAFEKREKLFLRKENTSDVVGCVLDRSGLENAMRSSPFHFRTLFTFFEKLFY